MLPFGGKHTNYTINGLDCVYRVQCTQHQMPSFSFRAEQPESYWDEFLVDFAINSMPGLGFLVGAGVAVAGVFAGLPLAGKSVALTAEAGGVTLYTSVAVTDYAGRARWQGRHVAR